jgi:hypothetical protein
VRNGHAPNHRIPHNPKGGYNPTKRNPTAPSGGKVHAHAPQQKGSQDTKKLRG